MELWRFGLLLLFFTFCMKDTSQIDYSSKIEGILQEEGEEAMTSMNALDKVKELHATNFIKVPYEEESEEYYYRLEKADYYLVYEGMIEEDQYYLFHLYEFVLDEEETGIGHTVTYAWYVVDTMTGEVLVR